MKKSGSDVKIRFADLDFSGFFSIVDVKIFI
jgi:hypothetical protein